MNKRQRVLLSAGVAITVLVPVIGTKRYNPPVLVGPPVAYHSGPHAGLISQNMIDAVTPGWAVYTALGLALLTGAAVYLSRSPGAA